MTDVIGIDSVFGGIDTPRALIISQNFCTNSFFTKNLDGWTNGGGSITREENINAYYQWMCKCQFTSGSDYVEYQYDYGSSIADKTFLFAINSLGGFSFDMGFMAVQHLD